MAVLAAVIYGTGRALGVREFPIVVALLFALVIGMPLGMWLFAPLRRRATAGLEQVTARRRHDREQLQARLRGEEPPASDRPLGSPSVLCAKWPTVAAAQSARSTAA